MDELENITQILKPFGIKTKNFNLNHIYLDKKRNLQSYSVKRWRETYKKKPKLDFDEETLQSAFKTLRDFDKKHEKDFFEKGKIEKIKSDLDILFDCIQYMPPNWILEVSLQFSIVFFCRGEVKHTLPENLTFQIWTISSGLYFILGVEL